MFARIVQVGRNTDYVWVRITVPRIGGLVLALTLIETGKRIRGARCYAGLSLDELADHMGVSRGTLWKVERGRRVARQGELVLIAEVCGVPRWFLTDPWPRLNGDPERRKPPARPGERG